MSQTSRKQGLFEHRRVVLEIARKRYPSTESITFALADAYDDSADPALRERGRLMIEKYLAIEHGGGGPEFRTRPGGTVFEGLMVLVNFYTNAGRWEWMLSVSNSAEHFVGPDHRVLRNKARALAKLGNRQEAEKEFKRAIELDPSDDTTHSFYSDFLDDEGLYEQSYKEHEEAALMDFEDRTRFINLAIQILNRGWSRDGEGRFVLVPARKERMKGALPLLLQALGVSENSATVRQRVISILVRSGCVVEA